MPSKDQELDAENRRLAARVEQLEDALDKGDWLIRCLRPLGKHPVRNLDEAEESWDAARRVLSEGEGS